jgi:hypothetical protein
MPGCSGTILKREMIKAADQLHLDLNEAEQLIAIVEKASAQLKRREEIDRINLS